VGEKIKPSCARFGVEVSPPLGRQSRPCREVSTDSSPTEPTIGSACADSDAILRPSWCGQFSMLLTPFPCRVCNPDR
jgi:hypothetical protein